MDKFTVLSLCIGIVLCGACGDTDKEVAERSSLTLFPGECLSDTDIFFRISEGNIYAVENGTEDYSGWFRTVAGLPLKDKTVKVVDYYSDYTISWIPSKDVWAHFGQDTRTLEAAYHSFAQELFVAREMVDEATVFYNGGMSIIADKDFAGYPGGTELSALFTYFNFDDDGSRLKTLLSGAVPPEDSGWFSTARPLKSFFTLLFPIGDHVIIDGPVNFTVRIPVRTGYLLTWLNDRLTDPEATMQFREETLEGTFTFQKGLR